MDDLTIAEAAGANIVESLPPAMRADLGAWLDSELGVYDLEAVRELGKHVI